MRTPLGWLAGSKYVRRCFASLLATLLFLAAFGGADLHAATPSGPSDLTRSAPPTGAQTSYLLHLPLVVAPTPALTSEQLVDRALAGAQIDNETALVYRVLAIFGDNRLPEAYRGDDSSVEDSTALKDLVQRYASLSPAARTILDPFVLRPPTPGSWLEREAEQNAAGAHAASPQITWGTVDTLNGKIKVWHQHRYAGDGAKADDIALALDAIIWPALIEELNMREPLSDGFYPDGGPDGRLDIYLVHMGNRGSTHPIDGCEETPSYILVNSDRPIGDATHAGILQTVVHELMHASQFAYPVKRACSEYDWWAEASAKWAEDHVYPLANSEQPYAPSFLNSIQLPLEDTTDYREYGAYLWPFYLVRTSSPAVVRRIWEETKDYDSLAATERVIQGGFEERWPEFATLNWNRVPVEDYNRWDQFPYRVGATKVQSIDVSLGGALDKKVSLDLSEGVRHLSSAYFHLRFTDPNARTVALYNGYTYKVAEQDVDQLRGREPGSLYGVQLTAETLTPEERQGAHVGALVKIAGQDWRVEDWSDKPIAVFCRDNADERLEELVLIFSNSLFELRGDTSVREPTGLAPTLWVSDIGCWRWEGYATWDFHDVGPYWDATYTHNAQVTWDLERPSVVSSASSSPDSLTYSVGRTRFKATGTVNKAVSGRWLYYSPPCVAEPQQVTVPVNDYGNNTMFVNNFTVEGPLYRTYQGSRLPTFETEEALFDTSCLDHQMPYLGGGEFRPPETPPLATITAGGDVMVGEMSDDNGLSAWRFTSVSEP